MSMQEITNIYFQSVCQDASVQETDAECLRQIEMPLRGIDTGVVRICSFWLSSRSSRHADLVYPLVYC